MRRSIIALPVVALLAGCGTSDQAVTRGQGAAGGAVVGALLGQIIGEDTESTLIGGLIGGAVGLAAGEVVARRKSAYASKEDLVEGEMTLVQEKAAATEAYNQELRQDIASLDREISNHQTAVSRGQDDRARAATLKREAEGKVEAADAQLAEVEQELEATCTLYADASAGAETRGLDDWQRTIEDLEEERAELTALIDDLKASSERI
ncbi:MAG: YMGG-like glycine zipper-containing protein [Geminicoccaceae bacterium]